MTTETILRAVSAVLWVIATVTIAQTRLIAAPLVRRYILGAAITTALWRIQLWLGTDFDSIPELDAVFRRVISPALTIALAFALVLAVRAPHYDE